ncbi:MAG: CDP-diacylglycerol--serine O-phosphatidyltransferase [Pirellulales bacterium]|nr:CDP-diacylglycerol--serine O-phosphatidyltransferase [Pirellulales bacterium]MBX3434227.1 CDP-diacylglycerol--serine O-phosphatidyltransferase [Pirellulales bacterium]
MRRIRAVAVFPTLFTLGNLVCGFFAIVVASRIARPGDETFVAPPGIEATDSAEAPHAAKPSPRLDSIRELLRSVDPTHNLMLCGGLIFAAMLLDMFDGQVARLAKVTSDFGAQLDSLCDVVSFGVAPAILLVKMCPQFAEVHREAIWCIAALFACCAAMRLARFNVEIDEEDDHSWFEGLPSPAAAAVIASFAMFSYTLRNEINAGKDLFEQFDWWLQRVLPLVALAIGLLMVSRIPYPHLVNHLLRGQRSFPQLVAIVFAVMTLVAVRWYAIPVMCAAYAIAPALWHGWQWHGWRRLAHGRAG